jgi:hypothetical protein
MDTGVPVRPLGAARGGQLYQVNGIHPFLFTSKKIGELSSGPRESPSALGVGALPIIGYPV